MKLKKIIILALLVTSIYNIVLYAEEDIPEDKPGTAVFVMSKDRDKILVSGESFDEKTKYFNIEMKIPIMDGFKSKTFQRKLNKKIRKSQLSYKDNFQKDALRICPSFPYELLTNYNVKSNDQIFSLEVSIYDYRGGAHGMTNNIYYNVNVEDSKLLSLNEYIFRENGNVEAINEEINRQIEARQEKGQVFFSDDQGFNGIHDNQAFYINKDGDLVIVFGLYEIAPYAEGIIEFPIPKEIIG